MDALVSGASVSLEGKTATVQLAAGAAGSPAAAAAAAQQIVDAITELGFEAKLAA